MRAIPLLGLALLLGCTSTSSTAPAPGPTGEARGDEARETPPPADPGSAAERRCLPVVAAECGCVYSCGLGTRDGDGWSVRHAHWDRPIRARIDRWCVDGECTDAFFGEIVCSGICAPRPADPTCVIDASGCRSGGE
ncbi:MAG TPA: hypothetical protein RMH99_06345 [Sandaracinaceae bacterium LLY-WYZ-13_1]|nr:hypothetical protein [Sandaracinaceae bacterium LLY-WYZ-13_1]